MITFWIITSDVFLIFKKSSLYAVFKVHVGNLPMFSGFHRLFYQPYKTETIFCLISLVKPVIRSAFPRCLGCHPYPRRRCVHPPFPTKECRSLYKKRFRFFSFFDSGSHLLSHAVSSIVPSAAWVLTIVFGMGTGVSPRRIATGKILLSVLSTQAKEIRRLEACFHKTVFLCCTS